MCLPEACRPLSGKVLRLNRCLLGPKQALYSRRSYFISRMRRLGFEQYPADSCAFRLVEGGIVTIFTVILRPNVLYVCRRP